MEVESSYFNDELWSGSWSQSLIEQERDYAVGYYDLPPAIENLMRPDDNLTAAEIAAPSEDNATARQELQPSISFADMHDIHSSQMMPAAHAFPLVGDVTQISPPPISDMDNGVAAVFNDPQPDNNSAVAFAPNPVPSTSVQIPNGMGPMFPSFDPPFSLPIANMAAPEPTLEESEDVREAQPAGLKAFAKLQFPDGIFYVNTTSLILGRDVDAAKRASRREAELEKMQQGYATPGQRRQHGSKYSQSVVSESGGIMRRGGDEDSDNNKRSEGKRKKSESSSSSAQRRNSLLPLLDNMVEYKPQIDMNAQAYAPNSDAAIPVDPEALRPSSTATPLVAIHPPGNQAKAYKSISRQHVHLYYNNRQNLWEIEVLGRNGCFVDEYFYARKEKVPLKSGMLVSIGGVEFEFILPDNVTAGQGPSDDEFEGHWQRDGNGGWVSPGGTRMSTNFEDRDGYFEKAPNGESLDESDDEGNPRPHIYGADDHIPFGDDSVSDDDLEGEEQGSADDEDVDQEDEDQDEERDLEEGQDEDENDEEETVQEPPPPPKRKGPGRPPKDGEMSKRLRRELLLKQAEERATKAGPESMPPKKNKVGRPRKHPLPETQPVKTEKRKYTKRKPKDPNAVKEGSNDDDEKASKEKKDKKPPRAARSPSPTFNVDLLTEEQLAKPSQNYVELIAEVLGERADGKMSLPQIYRAIQRKHPYFAVKVTTTGWQSSVRHNLSQHDAFKKVEKDGKGWMWALVPGVPTGKEKKQRQRTPPPQGPMYPQPIYTTQHHGLGPPPAGMMGPPPGYPNNLQMQPHLMQGQQLQYNGPVNGYGMHPGHPQMNGQYPIYPTQSPTSQQPGPSGTTYRSPYDPKPPTNSPPLSNHRLQQQQGNSAMASHLGRPIPQQLGPPVLNAEIHAAIESFKDHILGGMQTLPNAQAVVASAVSRVIGISNQSVLGGIDDSEDKIVIGLKKLIATIPGGSEFLLAVAQQQQRALQPPATPARNQPHPTMQAHTSNTTGSSRPNGVPISIPRPSVTHNMIRTNSGPPGNRPENSSASPAPSSTAPVTVIGGNSMNSAVSTTSIAIQSSPDAKNVSGKRQHSVDAEVGRENKVPRSETANDLDEQDFKPRQSSLDAKNSNGKRQRSEDAESGKVNGFKVPRSEAADDVTGQDFKPLQSSTAPSLRV